MTCDDLKNIKNEIPYQSPIQPLELSLDSKFQFNCHKGISCFNSCCKNIDITLLPYDIARLKRRSGLTSSQWVGRYTVPYPMDAHELPGLKMSTKTGSTECVFLEKSGCSVYSDRPSACRYYALGSMSVRRVDSPKPEDIYFVVKEPHCKGHEQPEVTTVSEYRRTQGLEKYDEMNRLWRELILKKRSAGPTIGKPSDRSLQLFDMCSYDLDNFREFIKSRGFTELFAIPEAQQAKLIADEDQLLLFSYRFLKQILFGEMSIPMQTDAVARRSEQKRRSAKSHPHAPTD